MKAVRAVIGLAVVLGVVTTASFAVFADSTSGGSVQGYAADSALDNGTIVELAGKDAKSVKAATKADVQNMFGVTVDRNQLPITLSNDNLKNEVYVAVSGTYNTLVSTENGSIKSGDYLTMSSLNGIAMKVGDANTTVFGRAQRAFDGTGVTLGTTTLNDTSGKAVKTVKIGLIPVSIDIRRNPNIKSTTANLPQLLQRLGQQISEKQVSPIRIYLSIAITVISVIAAIVILYSGVRHGLISIGRNPMSKKSIFRALLEVILTSGLILIIGLFAVYLLLKL